MRVVLLFLLSFMVLTGCVSNAPIKNYVAPGGSGLKWGTSCGSGVTRDGNTFKFSTGANTCKTNGVVTGTYRQRDEINTNPFSVNTKATYTFETSLRFLSTGYDYFRATIFQVHNGSFPGCQPPLSIDVTTDNIWLYTSYTHDNGNGFDCWKEEMRDREKFPSMAKINFPRDGSEHLFKVVLAFDGTAAFQVDVFLDGELVTSGKYEPPLKNPSFLISPHYYFKHGVYSSAVFDYEMYSTGMRLTKKK